jgi:hypothetical protein
MQIRCLFYAVSAGVAFNPPHIGGPNGNRRMDATFTYANPGLDKIETWSRLRYYGEAAADF